MGFYYASPPFLHNPIKICSHHDRLLWFNCFLLIYCLKTYVVYHRRNISWYKNSLLLNAPFLWQIFHDLSERNKGKGGEKEMMRTKQQEQLVERQFDHFCRTVLANKNRDLIRQRKRLQHHEPSLCVLPVLPAIQRIWKAAQHLTTAFEWLQIYCFKSRIVCKPEGFSTILFCPSFS